MAGSTFKTLAIDHSAASVAAGSDILAAVTIKRSGILNVAIAVDTSTIVQLGISDGTTTETLDLNGGVGLTAGVAYAFSFPAQKDYSYSLVNKTGATATTIMHAALLLEVPVG